MNITDLYYDDKNILSMLRLKRTIDHRFEAAKLNYLMEVPEEDLVEFLIKNFIPAVIYMASIYQKQTLIYEDGETDIFHILIETLEILCPGLTEPIDDKIHELSPDEYLELWYEVKEAKNIEDTNFYISLIDYDMEHQPHSEWNYQYEYRRVEQHDAFGYKLFKVFKKNYNKIVKGFYLDQDWMDKEGTLHYDDPHPDDLEPPTIEHL